MSGLLDRTKAYLAVRRRATSAQTTRPVLTQMMQVHTKKVSAVAVFKDGRRIITASEDKTLRIWNVKKRKLVGGRFVGHSGFVNSVAVSPDDMRIASGGADGTIIIWDVDSKQMVFNPLVEHTSWVSSVCFSPDGKRLASGSYDERAIIWDAKTGAVLSTLQGWSPVFCVSFSPDGLKLAFGTEFTIRVWNTNNVELLFDIIIAQVQSIVWLPGGQQIVSASYDETVKFWDSSNGTQIGQPCTGHTFYPSLAISSDGLFIATASDNNTIQLWSTKLHKQIGQPLKHTVDVCCVAISPNGELLVSGDIDGNLQLWSVENTLSATLGMDSSYESFLAHRSKVKLGQNLYMDALSDADKVIELNPSSYIGYELKYAALRGVRHYDNALEAFKILLSKLDDALDPQIRQLRHQYISLSELENAIRRAIRAQLENAPLRLINTITGHICDRNGQINAFTGSTEYKELLLSLGMRVPLQTEFIREVVAGFFGWVMLSHRWETEEPLLYDIQGKEIYDLDPVGTIAKLQKFCQVAHSAGHRWAWVDTCCIDQNNNIELQESVNSMFIWYHYSALTIVYLSDVPPSSNSGALANSTWNTRGWTVQEFLAPRIVLFYQADWTLYLNIRSHNHKESDRIKKELERSTGISARALADFRPGTRDAREKLQWASNRDTTREEDIAYSLFGIFDVNLPVIYGEKRQKALGRLLQEIIAHSGDITALDWVGRSSTFNSCLPAEISSYKAPPYTPSLSGQDMRVSISALRHIVTVESASKLYTTLENLGVPRFANARLQLPCIAFPLTEVRQSLDQEGARRFTYHVKADGLRDLLVTTKDKLVQFSPEKRTRQTFLLVRPWNRYDLGLINFAEETRGVEGWPGFGFLSGDTLVGYPIHNEPAMRELKLMVRLRQPFGGLLLAQQWGGEYKRIASDNNITAQVRDTALVDDMMDVRMLEIL
ncbi:WD40-repeat-containing domain protein [Suillus subaureus]|uniref:WD40-repeat-containing domain protein n=1 Tax=Suillus subaureus TaxID=48587 RepID=A0A9P7ELG1_9AGAM|nr:WD40-repeat-containing domain protein [Suillus subaureus]KAG1823960.1 WD40-repeat-containing domain protein [Suillus subaureus]